MVPNVERNFPPMVNLHQFLNSEKPPSRGVGRPSSFIIAMRPPTAPRLAIKFFCEFNNFQDSAGVSVIYPASIAPRRSRRPLSVRTTTSDDPGSPAFTSRYQGSPQEISASSPEPSGQR